MKKYILTFIVIAIGCVLIFFRWQKIDKYYQSIISRASMEADLGNKVGTGPLTGDKKVTDIGWDDVTAYKAGIEWKQSDKLTVRAGISSNTNPIKSDDVMLNILAPGVVQTRITGGFAYNTSDSDSLEFSAAYVPTVSVSGPEAPPGNPGHTIKVEMYQIALTAGWSRKF